MDTLVLTNEVAEAKCRRLAAILELEETRRWENIGTIAPNEDLRFWLTTIRLTLKTYFALIDVDLGGLEKPTKFAQRVSTALTALSEWHDRWFCGANRDTPRFVRELQLLVLLLHDRLFSR